MKNCSTALARSHDIERLVSVYMSQRVSSVVARRTWDQVFVRVRVLVADPIHDLISIRPSSACLPPRK